MDSTTGFVTLNDTAMALLKACKQAYSGAMYLHTHDGYGAIISITSGTINNVFFRNYKGQAALNELKQVDRVKFFFKGGSTSTAAPDALDNDTIFQQLGIEPSIHQANELKTVLVVEDSGMARRILVKTLTEQGYYVVEANDGEEALQQLVAHKPDLVLLDLILPKKDGYAVLDSMKHNASQKNIPVIVLTSRDALFDKLKGKMSGTDEYITKPVNTVELHRKLKKYLG